MRSYLSEPHRGGGSEQAPERWALQGPEALPADVKERGGGWKLCRVEQDQVQVSGQVVGIGKWIGVGTLLRV